MRREYHGNAVVSAVNTQITGPVSRRCGPPILHLSPDKRSPSRRCRPCFLLGDILYFVRGGSEMLWSNLLGLVFCAFLALGGCHGDDDDESMVCEPGATQLCYCAGGAEGAQVCEEDGSGWGICDCGSGDDDDVGDDDTGDDDTGDDDSSGDDDVGDDDTGDDDVGDDDTGDDDTTAVADWVSITGGLYYMGSNTQTSEQPIHPVTVPSFEMWRTEVTVAQYEDCVVAGDCSEPNLGAYCNWDEVGYEDHPVNCVDWYQADDFCEWIGGRLPSESEWEYAARSGGQQIVYPWGDQVASCYYAVMDDGGVGCGTDRTWEVCSKITGHSDQGLCDLAGNVAEWVQDWYHDSYDVDGGAPDDGSAWESPATNFRVVRGGGLDHGDPGTLRSSSRYGWEPYYFCGAAGFRCVR